MSEDYERIAFIERQARLERAERAERRAAVTGRWLWICCPPAVLVGVAALIVAITFAATRGDPNPTCDANLHLRPGETVTLNCPATLHHDTPLTPAR